MEICLGGRIIKARKNGPYEIRGEVQLIDFQGHPIPPPADGSIFLCRCGGSSTKKMLLSRVAFTGFCAVR